MPDLLKILVDVTRQRCELLSPSGAVLASYPVSTSRFGVVTEEGSYRTPLGNFIISKKIGGGELPWTIFKSRIPTGIRAGQGGEEDLILSRILWLDGLDPENSNTHDRYIYFHGTNQEKLIGLSESHGCIRLRNLDIVDLYDRIQIGIQVSISL